MEKKNLYIIIGIAVLVLTIFILPKLELFSVYGGNSADLLIYPSYTIYSYSGSQTLVSSISTNNQMCSQVSHHSDINCIGSWTYGASLKYGCSGTTCKSTTLYAELTQPNKQTINGRTVIPSNLNLYYQGCGGSSGVKIYFSINNPMTCTSTGCDGYAVPSDYDASGILCTSVNKQVIGLGSYIKQDINSIYLAIVSNSGSTNGYSIIRIPTDLTVQSACNTIADINCDGKVDRTELGVIITGWVNGAQSRINLANAITAWSSG